jgi:MATE family multidrug resistance protein
MAIFIARLGATAVAGHQIAANLVSLLFMMPLAIANATSTLVAQRLGARDSMDARRLGWHGLQIGLLMAGAMSLGVLATRESIVGLYTQDAAVVAAALSLMTWLALFHIADAGQAVAAFVLRAYRVAKVPLIILALALWGVGLGGGYVLAFDILGDTPASLRGAPGFWVAATAGLIVAAVALCAFLAWMLRRPQQASDPVPMPDVERP